MLNSRKDLHKKRHIYKLKKFLFQNITCGDPSQNNYCLDLNLGTDKKALADIAGENKGGSSYFTIEIGASRKNWYCTIFRNHS